MINSVSPWWIRTTSLCCVITNNITHPVQAHLCQNIQQVWKVNLIYLFLFSNDNILLTLVTSGDYIIRSLWVTGGNVSKQSCVFLSQAGLTVMKYWLFLISIHFPLIIQYWSDQSTDYASLNTTESWDPEDCSWLCGELFKLSVTVQYWITHITHNHQRYIPLGCWAFRKILISNFPILCRWRKCTLPDWVLLWKKNWIW